MRAALYHALQTATQDGDCYVTRREWLRKAEYLIGQGFQKHFAQMIERLIEDGHVYEVILPNPKKERVYYPRTHYRHETRLASQLKKIASSRVEPIEDLDEKISGYEHVSNAVLSPEQREAIHNASGYPISVITGGPGTGKTTVVRAIVNIFEGRGLTFSLAAFAGCAAKRLRESSGSHALTIHKTLAFDPSVDRFSKNAEEPLETDVLVLDETSMIDLSLLDHATQAVKLGTRLVLVGDVDQLPSIGPGATLRDIILSGVAPVARLETIFRQSQKSRIVTSSRRIRKGLRPVPAAVVNEEMRVVAHPTDPDVQLGEDTPLRDYVDLGNQKARRSTRW